MKHRLPIFALVFLVLAWLGLRAEIPGAGSSGNTPSGTTLIDADELRMDQQARTAIYSGDVTVTGTDYNMTCQEMTVFFTGANKIDNILAQGKVIILQPGRIIHCGQAQYFREEDKFVLTDQPDIIQNNYELQAPKIIVYRERQLVEAVGPSRTRYIEPTTTEPKSP